MRSNGSELIPSEVQAKVDDNGNLLVAQFIKNGYTIDDEGIINNYAIEPKIYRANYPAPYQQRRYLLQGLIAIIFITFIMWIAFNAS